MPVNHPRMRVTVRVADLAHFALSRYPEPFTAADAAEACDCSPEVAGYVLGGGYPRTPGRVGSTPAQSLRGTLQGTPLELIRERSSPAFVYRLVWKGASPQ